MARLHRHTVPSTVFGGHLTGSPGPAHVCVRCCAVDAAVLIPIKAFHEAKARLAGALDRESRAQLARWSALRVLEAAAPLPVAIACDDPTVADWGHEHGARVLWEPGKGLNVAVDDAVAALGALGYDHVVVAHADLPLPAGLPRVARTGTITLVPDDRDDGTNVMSFPIASGMRASYGAGSYRRHLDAALALAVTQRVAVEVRRDPRLALDLDIPADLVHPLLGDILPPWLPTNRDNPTSRHPH